MEKGKRKKEKGLPRVAIVHDWLVGGGAEKVVLELHNMFPEAPIYTSYSTDEWRKKLGGKVVTGYLQDWPFGKLRKFLPLLRMYWFSHLDLKDYDLIISSSGNGEAKFIRPKNPLSTKQLHICYCHTPPHFYWRKYEEYLATPGFKPYWLVRLGMKILVKPLRKRDYIAAQSVDHFIANSTHIQADIKKYYNRESTVIHPPVDTDRFGKWQMANGKLPRSGFITVGRQTPYKRTDLIISACNELGLPLKVIGTGPEHERLVLLAGPTISFLTNVSDQDMPSIMGRAEAFLFAAEEDFGITPVEAMASGTPVIAYRSGGALDYVIPKVTGEFFSEQTANSLIQVLKDFNPRKYAPSDIKSHAKGFSKEQFHKSIQSFIENVLQ